MYISISFNAFHIEIQKKNIKEVFLKMQTSQRFV